MAYLHRLIFCLCVGFLSWLPMSSFADGWGPWNPSDPASYCPAAFTATNSAQYGWTYIAPSIASTASSETASCLSKCTDSVKCGASFNVVGGYGGHPVRTLSCANGPDGSGGCLACPSGQTSYTTVVDGGSTQGCAVKPPCSDSGGVVLGSVSRPYTGSFSPTTYECVGGCVAKTKFDFRAKYTDSAGVSHDEQVGDSIGTGGSCNTQTADATTPQKPAPLNSTTNPNSAKTAACPPGQVPRTVNGVSVCGAPTAGSETSSTSTSSTTAPDGTKTQIDKTTTCIGSECTTTTRTTTTPPGQPPTDSTQSDTQDKSNLCKDNPGLSICKTSSFAGACGAPPSCDGDAVMCAVAAATFATNCVLKDPGALTPLYDAAKDKTGDQTNSLPGNSSVSVGAGSFDQTELMGVAAGMTDRSITVMGATVVLPFSSVNVWLARLGVILQACTFLLCARIVTRG